MALDLQLAALIGISTHNVTLLQKNANLPAVGVIV